MAPRKEGQVEAMQRAYPSLAEAAKVGYVEAHATSTQVGDATEVSALQEFYGRCGIDAKNSDWQCEIKYWTYPRNSWFGGGGEISAGDATWLRAALD